MSLFDEGDLKMIRPSDSFDERTIKGMGSHLVEGGWSRIGDILPDSFQQTYTSDKALVEVFGDLSKLIGELEESIKT